MRKVVKEGFYYQLFTYLQISFSMIHFAYTFFVAFLRPSKRFPFLGAVAYFKKRFFKCNFFIYLAQTLGEFLQG